MIRVVDKVNNVRSLKEISKNLLGNLKIEIPSCEQILVSPMLTVSLSLIKIWKVNCIRKTGNIVLQWALAC
jgi:hypothetical protein